MDQKSLYGSEDQLTYKKFENFKILYDNELKIFIILVPFFRGETLKSN